MAIVIFSAITLMIFTFIVILAHMSHLREDERVLILAKENTAIDVQHEHNLLCGVR